MKAKYVDAGKGIRGIRFICPGCNENHSVPVEGEGAWQFNGDLERPTISPSILLRNGHFDPAYDGGSCWCTFNAEHPEDPPSFICRICHSYVTDGKIQFLNDCTHALAGQTVELPNIDEV